VRRDDGVYHSEVTPYRTDGLLEAAFSSALAPRMKFSVV
jgi:hypothetical protein